VSALGNQAVSKIRIALFELEQCFPNKQLQLDHEKLTVNCGSQRPDDFFPREFVGSVEHPAELNEYNKRNEAGIGVRQGRQERVDNFGLPQVVLDDEADEDVRVDPDQKVSNPSGSGRPAAPRAMASFISSMDTVRGNGPNMPFKACMEPFLRNKTYRPCGSLAKKILSPGLSLRSVRT
jgi:hypothetical protein